MNKCSICGIDLTKENQELEATIYICKECFEKARKQSDSAPFFPNEPTADEMFSELGYEKNDDGESCRYSQRTINDGVIWFIFDKTQKTITLSCCEIEASDIKAISQKIKELGWEENNGK